MEMRHFKNEALPVSLLGFGAMRLPLMNGGGGGEVDAPLTRRMVDYAFDHGVNYFDTAYVYHDGRSETILGEALARFPRERYRLATKMPTWEINTEADIERIFDEQLRRCRVDHFDFYLAHNLNETLFRTAIDMRVYEHLQKRREKGQIRWLGFSFHDRPPILEKILLMYPWDFAQIQLNYLDWEVQDARTQYKLLTDAGVPVIVMEPLRGGALARLPEDALAVLREADPTAGAASWALRYAASLPNVLTVLSGMSDLEQVRDNVATMSHFRPLDESERATLARALTLYRRAGSVPCTYCRYCMPCPAGVEIPKSFAIYNQYKVSDNDFMFGMEYETMGADKQAGLCTRCGACLPKCPQHIAIPDRLADVVKEVKEEAE